MVAGRFGFTDAWAAGYQGFGAAQRTLLAHWDGARWRQIAGRAGSLSDLAAISSRDVWAVGGSVTAGGATRTLIERYACR